MAAIFALERKVSITSNEPLWNFIEGCGWITLSVWNQRQLFRDLGIEL
jgi:hypothetical protein